MQPFLQMGIGILAAVAVSLVFIFQSSFGDSRHALSIIGAIAIVISSLYILRTRLIRWSNRSRMLKYHQGISSFGLCLVLVHSGIKPETWHSWLMFCLAWLDLGSGVAVSLAKAGGPANPVALPFGIGAHSVDSGHRAWARET